MSLEHFRVAFINEIDGEKEVVVSIVRDELYAIKTFIDMLILLEKGQISKIIVTAEEDYL